MSTIYLVEMVGADAAGALTTFRYATEGYSTTPSDSPANTHYEGRVVQPGLMRRNMHGDRRTFGPPDVGYGLIELANDDGGLDALINYGFDGQLCRVLRGDSEAAYSSFAVVFHGTMDQVAVTMSRVTARIRDGLQKLTVPVQQTKFAGSNSLPDGLEGTADDLKGRPKPICYGYVYNATPPCVNTSRLIYQLHDDGFANDTFSGINWSISVYDKRVALTAGALKTLAQFQAGSTNLTFTVTSLPNDELTTSAHGYATGDSVSVNVTGGTLAAPLVNTTTYFVRVVSATVVTLHPTAADANAGTNRINITDVGSGTQTISNNRTAVGAYDWCNDTAGFYIRLGSTPVGAVTFDAVNPKTVDTYGGGAQTTCMPSELAIILIYRIYGSSVFGDGSPTISRSAGIFINEERVLLDVVTEVLASYGLTLICLAANQSYLGYFIVDQLGSNVGVTNNHTLLEEQIINIERVALADDNEGIPVWRVNLSYRRNWTPMTDADLASSVSQADRAWLANSWRGVSAEDANVKLQYPSARELNRQSHYTNSTHASTEASRLLTQYKARRDCFVVRVPASLALTMDLNDRITVTHSRFGLSAGVLFYVLGLQPNFADNTVDITLWK